MQKALYRTQIKEYTKYLDSKMIDYLSVNQIEAFESFPDFNLMVFDWYDVTKKNSGTEPILIYMDREDLFFFCETEKGCNKCSELLTEGNTNERALYLFFTGILKGDMRRLEGLESEITEKEDEILVDSRRDYLKHIHSFHKELLRLKRYYDRLHVIMDNLTANDNGIISKDGVRHFYVAHNRVDHYCSRVMILRDYVTQMREACQAQLDLEQNNLMRIFTVITAVFLPLTLIVGWYGMNFKNMPELTWEYGYMSVIALSIAVCVGLIAYFKRKRWF